MVGKVSRRSRRRMNCKGRIGDVEWALIRDWSLHQPSGHPKVSLQEIADRLNVSRGAVQYSLAQPVRPSLRKKATPPPISSAQARAIVLRRQKVKQLVQMTVGTGRRQRPKFPSCELIAQEMRRALQSEDWHYATVYRDLLHLGYTSKVRPHISAEKGKSDPVQRFNCCEWMLENVDLEWMIFSDEKYFDDSDHGTRRQWCLGDEKPQPLEETQFCTTAHFWGCIARAVPSPVRRNVVARLQRQPWPTPAVITPAPTEPTGAQSTVICRRCNGRGHIERDCPSKR